MLCLSRPAKLVACGGESAGSRGLVGSMVEGLAGCVRSTSAMVRAAGLSWVEVEAGAPAGG